MPKLVLPVVKHSSIPVEKKMPIIKYSSIPVEKKMPKMTFLPKNIILII